MGKVRLAIWYFLFLPIFSIGQQVGIAGQQVDITNNKIYTVAQQMPKFPGNADALTDYIRGHTNYPQQCLDSNIGGTVYVQFIVTAEGHVANVKVLRPVHPLLDAEAVNVVSGMPDWKPGKQDGQEVSVYYTVPVGFGSSKQTNARRNEEEPATAETFTSNPYYYKVLELLDRNNSKGALKEVNKLLRDNPKSGDLLLLRGIVHCYRKEHKESVKDMDQASLLGGHIKGIGSLVDQYCK